MKYFPFMMPGLFWLGILTIKVKRKPDLKARAELFARRYISEESKNSLGRAIAGARTSLIQDRLERELSESLAYIKNLVILGRGKSISAELLLTELSEISRALSPVYLDMAHWLHLNEKERAAKSFSERFRSSYAVETGQFLARWEDIEPSELLSGIELYQSALREERMTKQVEKDEMISDLVYFPVVLNCMAVLLNFIYVAYFIAQKDSLGMLMG
ncbi:MAG: hypothetical protein IJM17_09715 [Firmicutes bacterium]|nr:hypothetical protein [Bacillota bacterium]